MTAYQFIAPLYDRLLEPFNAGLRRAAWRVHRPGPGDAVLDIGCGTGALLAELATEGCQVAGVDPSASMLAQARAKLDADAPLFQASATELPFPDDSFDLVTSTLVLHELPAGVRERVVTEARRVVRRDGRILLVDFHPPPYRWRGWLRRPAIVAIELAAGWEHYRNHRDFFRRGGLPALAARAELTVEELRPVAGGALAIALLSRSA